MKFKFIYNPKKNLSINSELLLLKGRLGFKQHIQKKKRSRFDIKMLCLCEVSSYLFISLVYLGEKPALLSEETLHKRAWT